MLVGSLAHRLSVIPELEMMDRALLSGTVEESFVDRFTAQQLSPLCVMNLLAVVP